MNFQLNMGYLLNSHLGQYSPKTCIAPTHKALLLYGTCLLKRKSVSRRPSQTQYSVNGPWSLCSLCSVQQSTFPGEGLSFFPWHGPSIGVGRLRMPVVWRLGREVCVCTVVQYHDCYKYWHFNINLLDFSPHYKPTLPKYNGIKTGS